MARFKPFEVRPLQPTLVQPFHRPGWVYEEKVDGWRIVAYKTGRDVRLVSRKGVEHTARFPELTNAVAALPGATLVLDGEVAVFDEQLVSRFEFLAEPNPEVVTTPPLYMVFDVLYARGRGSPGTAPLGAPGGAGAARGGLQRGLPVRRLASDGRRAWEEVLARGIEGYVGKDPTSTYLAVEPPVRGSRRRCGEGRFVVGGVVERSEGWSLLLGSVQGDRLLYRGLVHAGVDRRLPDTLTANALVRTTSPFSERITERGVKWLEPRLTVEVTYTHIMSTGALRAPLFRGFVTS